MTCDPADPRRSALSKRTSWSATALLLATTTTAQAGALDRTLQPVGVLFEKGLRRAELRRHLATA